MRSYFEEFEKKYNRPQMNNITVGFSGIDLAPKNNNKKVDDNTIIFYTSTDKTGTAAISFDSPNELVLDKLKNVSVGNFTFNVTMNEVASNSGVGSSTNYTDIDCGEFTI